jgi:thioesterase domain-containing protein
MMISVQNSGANPPLYFVHGIIGVMPIGRFLARSLGTDQPLYAIHVNGIDGRGPMPKTVKDMARSYAEAIFEIQPSGRLFIAGMCEGVLIAIEVARELQAKGLEVGPVIVVDPPTVPPGHIRQNQSVDPNNPAIAAQLYQRVRGPLLKHASLPYNDLPFAADDEKQLHLATLAGINSLTAIATHVPEIFPGPATVILSTDRAAGFFHPQMYWIKLLPRMQAAHVLACPHMEIFRSARHEFARVLKFVLDGVNSLSEGERASDEPAFASAY